MRTDITLPFADGQYRFRLGMTQIIALEEACNCGIGELYGRLMRGRYVLEQAEFGNPLEAMFRLNDVKEVIRQGLLGGNQGIVDEQTIEVAPHLANTLIKTYVLDRPLREGWAIAAHIIDTCIQGYEPAQKKSEAENEEATASTGGKSSPTDS